jgi:hypothetical protein
MHAAAAKTCEQRFGSAVGQRVEQQLQTRTQQGSLHTAKKILPVQLAKIEGD